MNPKIWGPSAWKFIHNVSLAYPEDPSLEDKDNMRTFINILPKILPCEKCKYNCMTHIETLKLTDDILSSRDKLIKWFIDLHNCVNKMNGAKELTYKQAIESFNKTSKSPISVLSIILVILFLIIVLVPLYYKYFKN